MMTRDTPRININLYESAKTMIADLIIEINAIFATIFTLFHKTTLTLNGRIQSP